MVKRNGVFIGAYVPADLKESLIRQAKAESRNLSQEIIHILATAVYGNTLLLGDLERRGEASTPRRRATDPETRRRSQDAPNNGSRN